jgi:serine protease Do
MKRHGNLAAALVLCATGARADLASRRNGVVDVVQRVSPAVVYIGAEQLVESRYRDPVSQFFDQFFGQREDRQAVQSLGSGVIIDPTGIIVTNDHVIHGASTIHVVLADGRKLEAEVIGSDADNDLAVLKVQSKTPLPIAKLAAGPELLIGETAIAIGSPFGLSKTVTVGVVSAVGRSFKANNRVYNDFLQTDASINPGNSGGPLLDVDGDVIGINSAIYASGQGIGFAIPAVKVRRIVDELTHFGKVRPAWIGAEVQALAARAAQQLGWDRTYGALVAFVEPGSPAEKAGVQRGDIVAEVDGVRIEDAEDFDVRMRGYTARAPLKMTLFRAGSPQDVIVTPVEFPAKLGDNLAWERLGLRVKAGAEGLLITSVRRGSEAAEIGLQPGDSVLRVNNQRMTTQDAWREALIAARTSRSVLLLVAHGGRGYNIPLRF